LNTFLWREATPVRVMSYGPVTGLRGEKPVCEILKPRRNTNLAAVEHNGGVIHIICGTTQILNSDSSPQQQC